MTLIEMELHKIRIDERRGEQVIVLKERDGDRLLPIVIGIMEVTAIKMQISGITPPRPMTHDLLFESITKLGAQLDRVIIDRLELNTFFARLMLYVQGKDPVEIDARPSDSIALALRAHAAIYVNESVLDQVAANRGDAE